MDPTRHLKWPLDALCRAGNENHMLVLPRRFAHAHVPTDAYGRRGVAPISSSTVRMKTTRKTMTASALGAAARRIFAAEVQGNDDGSRP
jgi:hypothetical protein